MNPKANAVLLTALTTLKSNDKAKSVCDSHTSGKVRRTGDKEERVVVARVDAGREDWVRFKSECVLLKGRK